MEAGQSGARDCNLSPVIDIGVLDSVTPFQVRKARSCLNASNCHVFFLP